MKKKEFLLFMRKTEVHSSSSKVTSLTLEAFVTPFLTQHSDLDYRIVSKKDFQTSFLGQEHLIA